MQVITEVDSSVAVGGIVKDPPPNPDAFIVKFYDATTNKLVRKIATTKQFLSQLLHFEKLFQSGMKELEEKTITVKIADITSDPVMMYFHWLKWRKEGFAGKSPFALYHPYASTIAEYFGDDFYLRGGPVSEITVTIREIQWEEVTEEIPPQYRWGDDTVTTRTFKREIARTNHMVKIPAGFYTDETLLKKFLDSVNALPLGHRFESVFIRDSMFMVRPTTHTNSHYSFSCSAGSAIICEWDEFKIEIPQRIYDLTALREDFPKGIPIDLAGVLCEQYINEVATLRGNNYRKLAKFTVQIPIIAKISWESNAMTICEMLGVPKHSRNKASGMKDLTTLRTYAESLARRYEPVRDVDIDENDVQLGRIQARIDELYTQLRGLPRGRFRLHKLLCEIEGTNTRDEIYDQIEIAERQWNERYEKLAANARKRLLADQRRANPNYYKYYMSQ